MKLTLHRALAELKLLDDRINKQTLELLPTGIFQKDKLINGRYKEEEFAQTAQAKLQSVNDLIDRKHHLKSAIVKANAETPVIVAGQTLMIAEAINYKVIVEQKKKLLQTLRHRLAEAVADKEKRNLVVEQNLQKVLEATFGKDNVKITKDDMEAVRKPFLEANEWQLFDPLKVEEVIQKMEKEVTDFETEVDAVLSEINAITTIEV